jgi:glycosyltransferase involved in cell wall biosynthesis
MDRPIMVVCFSGTSGLTDYSVALCHALAPLVGVELVTARSFDPARYPGRVDFPVVRLFRRTRQLPLDFWRFVAYVLRRRPQVLLLQSWIKWPSLELPWIALFRSLGIRVALTVHDLLPHDPMPWSARVLRGYYRRFDRLIVHSQRSAQGLAALGVPAMPLVVPHGVYDLFDTRQLSRAAARSGFAALAGDDFVVLFFGHLEQRKGVLELIDAARALEDVAGLKFVFAGKPEARAAVRRALEAARGRPNVIVHDHVIAHDDVQRYFAACDLVALPYREGTTSGVLKLAMAFARPIIASDVGDLAEALESWPGIAVDPARLGDDLAAKLRGARDAGPRLAAGTAVRLDDAQWPRIAQHYAGFLLEPDRVRTDAPLRLHG